jgi:hypothetical protein
MRKSLVSGDTFVRRATSIFTEVIHAANHAANTERKEKVA